MSASPKACEQCSTHRVAIGKRFSSLPAWRRYAGSMLIFLPLVVSLPFVLIGAWVLYAHLRVMGAKNIKGYWEFVPAGSSYRYSKLSDQIVFKMDPTAPWSNVKAFWQFNCNFYCPLSVGLYEWSTYLVKAVENFWCPFFHERKATYAESAIDQSYWHMKPEGRDLLHPEDRDCTMWNEDAG
ncbi:hypothetical protein [Methylomagnum sp.]